MAAALEYAGYDYRFAFGTAGHNGHHGMSVLGETLRWMFGPPVSHETEPPQSKL